VSFQYGSRVILGDLDEPPYSKYRKNLVLFNSYYRDNGFDPRGKWFSLGAFFREKRSETIIINNPISD
jgi:hypothetical protein